MLLYEALFFDNFCALKGLESESVPLGRVITDLSRKVSRKFRVLVGHINPDEDVWLGFWIAERFGLCEESVEYRFVPAGTALPGSANDPTVMHVDTGGGEFDQHGRSLEMACSAGLLAKKLGITEDPGLKAILEWVTIVDNAAAKLPPTHVHFQVTALPRQRSCQNESGETDWMKVKERVYEIFDNIYNQEVSRIRAELDLPRFALWKAVSQEGGRQTIKVCFLFERPYLREAAYQKGADVVVWTTRNDKKGRYYVGVQVSRDSVVRLSRTAALLRFGEARKRGVELSPQDLTYIGQKEPLLGWFLHDSLKLVLCGSPKAPLQDHEYTLLSPQEIEKLVCIALADEK